MTDSTWDGLTPLESRLMVCAMEGWGLLPQAYEAAGERATAAPSEMAAAVLNLVDLGWVEVRRIESRPEPDGEEVATYGDPIGRDDLPGLLADPDTWDAPREPSWIGEVTLTQTDAWIQAAATA
ncbi:MAG TPA: hypothetical protein VGM10_07430 [Actinocrinis sp.]